MVIDGPISKELEETLILYKDLNIRLIRNIENLGLSAALQKALNAIKDEYDYVIRFDSDDINDPKRFEIIVNFFTSYDVDLLSSHMHEIDENGDIFSKRDVPVGQNKIKRKFPYRNPINHPASAFRLTSVISVGGYKEMPFLKIGIYGFECTKLDLKYVTSMIIWSLLEQLIAWWLGAMVFLM